METTGNVIKFQDVARAVDGVLSIMLNHITEIGLSVDEFEKLLDYKDDLHNISEILKR